MVGSHTMKHWPSAMQHWPSTHIFLAQTSGEAELNAMLKAASEGLSLQYLIQEVGVQVGLHLLGDSSASHGTLQRLGSGRVKHLQTRQLWLQEEVFNGEVTVQKIPRERNWADLLTHSWTPASEYLFAPMGVVSVVDSEP